MNLDFAAIVNALESHAGTLGLFDSINGHEPASPPPSSGLTAAIWAQHVGPAPAFSGLAVTSALVIANLRIYKGVQSGPADSIDPQILAAASALFGAYSADFDLGGTVSYVDLLGQHGTALAAEAGYVPQSDAVSRVMTLNIPLVLENVWTQSA